MSSPRRSRSRDRSRRRKKDDEREEHHPKERDSHVDRGRSSKQRSSRDDQSSRDRRESRDREDRRSRDREKRSRSRDRNPTRAGHARSPRRSRSRDRGRDRRDDARDRQSDQGREARRDGRDRDGRDRRDRSRSREPIQTQLSEEEQASRDKMINAIWKWADQDGDGFLNRAESDRLQEKIEGAKLTDAEWAEALKIFGADPEKGPTLEQYRAVYDNGTGDPRKDLIILGLEEHIEESKDGGESPTAQSRPKATQSSSQHQAQEKKKEDVPDWLSDIVGPQALAAPAPAPGPRMIVVPQQFVSKVVGFQGCTVNEIQLATKTYIQMNQSTQGQGYSVATVTGPDAACLDHAEMMIKERINLGQGTLKAYANGKHGMGKGGRIQLGLPHY